MAITSLPLLAAALLADAVFVQPRPPGIPAVQPSTDWPDAPLTPGRWTYRPGADRRGSATFGSSGSDLQIGCPGRGAILIGVPGSATSVTVRTSALSRTLNGRSESGRLTIQLPANDPLLDAMAFSRGRFAIQSAGRAPMIVPAWPELARVVEDCRR